MGQRAQLVVTIASLLAFLAGCTDDRTTGGGKPQAKAPPALKADARGHEREANEQRVTDAYLDALFAGPNEFDLVDGVYKRIVRQCDGTSARQLAELPEPQRVVLHVWGTWGLVDEGGIDRLFGSKLADFAGILAAFEAIGASAAADAVRDALALFPDSRPQPAAGQRSTFLEQLSPPRRQKLQACTRRFREAGRLIERGAADYVRAHRAIFAGLPPDPQEDLARFKGKNLAAPDPEAYSRDVARWLESVGASILVDRGDRQEPSWVSSNLDESLRGQARIIGVSLAAHRRTTDDELANMVKLEALREVAEVDLESTYVTARGLSVLRQLPELRTLSLRRTDASDAWLVNLQALAKLAQLDVGRTQITEAGLEHAARVPALVSLDLDHTAVSSQAAAALNRLPNLERISLAATDIDDEALTGLSAAARLRSLDLRETAVTDEGLREIALLIGLQDLDLSATRVGDLGLLYLRSLPDLQYLNLSETQVTDQGLAVLYGLANLRGLSLEGTDVTEAGIQRLQQSARSLEILRK